MNIDQMRKNIGCHVRLVPPWCRLDESGFELPTADDDWRVEAVTADGVRITNTRTDHATTLAFDQIQKFTSNPQRSGNGVVYGFFTLTVQLFLKGDKLDAVPNLRPGERVMPAAPAISDKWVDGQYIFESGIQEHLQLSGFDVAWANDERLTTLCDFEGWQIVIESDKNGNLNRFRRKGQTLIKRAGGYKRA